MVDSELPLTGINRATALVTKWLQSELRQQGVENPERYVVSYVRNEPQPVQEFVLTASPEDEALRIQIIRHVAEKYGIPEVTDEPDVEA